jgi:hypothetical protein
LQAAKDFLESEGERVQREPEHYTTLTQMASASVKIISVKNVLLASEISW